MADRIQDLGVFTAYGEAREAGYEGTKAEFEEGLKKAAEAYDEAEAAAAAAAQSATAAATSAVDASTAAAEADSSADAAQASEAAADVSAGAAASSAIDAGESADAASAAQTGAETAQVAAELAQTAAEAAAAAADGSKTAAAGSASAAASSATAAAGSATAASGSATAAASSATAAAGSASDAAASATAAAGSAEDAAESAAEAAATLESYAHVDGTYEEMTVGNAEQLVSKVGVIDKVPYTYRTSGGELDIGDREIVERIVGGTIAWNQQVTFTPNTETDNGITYTKNSDGSITVNGTATDASYQNPGSTLHIVEGHKILIIGCPAGGSRSTYCGRDGYTSGKYDTGNGLIIPAKVNTIYQVIVANGATVSNLVFKPQIFDLTQMFGSTIADWLYSLEQTTEGAGVAWFKKLFPKDYYAYNAGELMSVQAAAHNLVGFNQWDEEWEVGGIANGVPIPSSNQMRSKNFCHILPDTTYYATCGKTDGGNQNRYYLAVVLYDDNLNFISNIWANNLTFTTPPNAKYFKIGTNSAIVVYGATYNHDICINLAWDGEHDSEYQPYELHSYPLDDSLTLRGVPMLDASNSLYYDGDIYESDGAVQRRYGIVDLGTLAWVRSEVGTFYAFNVTLTNISRGTSLMVCDKYVTWYGTRATMPDKVVGKGNLSDSLSVFIRDDAYTDAATFQTAMSGVYLVYELATPTTEEAEPYRNPQIVDDWGTEEYVDAGTRDVAIPVGHETFYQQNLRAKLEAAPNSPVSNGDYIMRQTNGANAYVPLVIPQELPTMPTSDGTYSLQVTISGGTPTLAWVQNQ